MSPAGAKMAPTSRRILITVCAMTATIMQALDTTIANVALPYMQGSLSASLDQINWVLTSYIVAAAIMTAPIGWLADRFGRKKLFIICVAGFTAASLLCALAQNIEQMVLFRLLQGMAGAALVPLSQSVMLDSYSLQERAKAMAIWGMGVMLGPIMGPTLGAWLTDNYSWHWVFLINLPIGVLTVAGMMLFMEETKKQEHLIFDWFGFIALAIGIGSLQLMLDRGEQVLVVTALVLAEQSGNGGTVGTVAEIVDRGAVRAGGAGQRHGKQRAAAGQLKSGQPGCLAASPSANSHAVVVPVQSSQVRQKPAFQAGRANRAPSSRAASSGTDPP